MLRATSCATRVQCPDDAVSRFSSLGHDRINLLGRYQFTAVDLPQPPQSHPRPPSSQRFTGILLGHSDPGTVGGDVRRVAGLSCTVIGCPPLPAMSTPSVLIWAGGGAGAPFTPMVATADRDAAQGRRSRPGYMRPAGDGGTALKTNGSTRDIPDHRKPRPQSHFRHATLVMRNHGYPPKWSSPALATE